uniref:Uncharacterized protein n=1 Tax=Leersia perrieri TaxID=77586 RepID=A0A0D9W125_9ORYZ
MVFFAKQTHPPNPLTPPAARPPLSLSLAAGRRWQSLGPSRIAPPLPSANTSCPIARARRTGGAMSKPADQSPPSDMEVDATAAEEKPLVRFSINVLELMREAQMQHGLRHGDYTRYRLILMQKGSEKSQCFI